MQQTNNEEKPIPPLNMKGKPKF
uniref:Uncharacterized protein n=1 Tax=Rhizophora mucronata TaxID=61149 RepID=A0A2P2NEN4_RHIMU